MKPYTTTVEHILPGMIVRVFDEYDGKTAVLTVTHTYMYENGSAAIGGDMPSVEVKHDSEITVLHDPTQGGQTTRVSAKRMSDDEITSSIRRSAERVMAAYGGRGPQQYKTGGVKTNVTRWDQLGPAQPITMHGTPGMYLAPEITGYKDHLIVLTEHDETGAFLYQYRPGTSTDVPEGLATAGPSLCDTRHLGWVHPFDR